MYVVYPHKSNRYVGDHLRASLEIILVRYQVDLTIAGHVHSYYRTCAVFDEECMDDDQNNLQHASIPVNQTNVTQHAEVPRQNLAASIAAPAPGQTSIHRGLQSVQDMQMPNGTSNTATILQDSSRGSSHGITHFIIGTAGHRLSDVEKGQEDWCVARARRWGYGRFTVHGADSMTVEFVCSETGDVLDTVQLTPAQVDC